MNGILRFLLLFLIVFYLVRYITRLFSLYKPNKVQHQDPEHHDYVGFTNPNASNSKKTATNEGDYVDFEEVK